MSPVVLLFEERGHLMLPSPPHSHNLCVTPSGIENDDAIKLEAAGYTSSVKFKGVSRDDLKDAGGLHGLHGLTAWAPWAGSMGWLASA